MFSKRSKRNPSRLARPSRDKNYSAKSGLEEATRQHRPDYALLVIALVLLVMGLIVVYSISPGLAVTRNVSEGYFISKQLIAIGLGLLAFAIFSFLPLRAVRESSNVFAGVAILAAIGVQFFGNEVNGASRWIQAGGLSFQVAELIKLALVVWLAYFLTKRISRKEVESSSKTLRPLIGLMIVIGVIVAKLESDLGSAGVMIAIILVMAFVAGLPIKRISLIMGLVAIGTVLAISTSSYRRQRVSTFLNPSSDCQTTGYQACQAMIAVGSGGVFGLGLGKSVQAYGYLPEAANDSIFAVVAEKFGFVGVSIIIAIYLWLFTRFRNIISRSPDIFSRLLVVGILVWFSVQAVINIGAMIGLLPLKGITLPFISYGGTSLVFVMAALGIVFQVSRYTSFMPIRNLNAKKGENNEHISRRRRQRRPYYASTSNR